MTSLPPDIPLRVTVLPLAPGEPDEATRLKAWLKDGLRGYGIRVKWGLDSDLTTTKTPVEPSNPPPADPVPTPDVRTSYTPPRARVRATRKKRNPGDHMTPTRPDPAAPANPPQRPRCRRRRADPRVVPTCEFLVR